MKIVFVTYNLKIGGAQKALVKIAKSVSLAHNVTLICLTEDGEIRKLIPPSVNIVLLGKKKLWSAIPQLVRQFYIIRPQVVFSTVFIANLSVILLKQLRFIDSKIVLREETTPSKVKHTKYKDKIVLMFCKILFKNSNIFVAPSLCSLNDSIKMYGLNPNKTIVIPNPVLNSNEIKRFKIIEKGNCKLIFVGRISREKQIHIQLGALSILKDNLDYRFKLHIIGPFVDQTYKTELFNLVKALSLDDVVFFEGQQIDVTKYYNEANVLLLTSEMEGFPSVIVEALAEGVKVVANDCKCGPNEILDNGKYGVLINDCNEESLAKAILEGIEQKIEQEELNKHLQQYSFKAVQKKYLNLFETLN